MKARTYINKLLVLSSMMIFFFEELYAAGPPGPPGGGGGGPPCWPPSVCIPIDGGISLLVAAGVLYGGKKLYDMSKDTIG